MYILFMCSGWIWRWPKEEESRKERKKRIKTAAKKRTAEAGTPFEPLVPETRISISALEDVSLFSIQSSEEKFRPDLDRDLADVKAEAREVVPMVSGNENNKDMCLIIRRKF